MQLLIVDPDIATANALDRSFRRQDWRSIVVGTGEEALKEVGWRAPDCVVSELDLPDVDGLLLVSDIRRKSQCGIIVCSNRAAQVDRVLSLRLGADDFVEKPFDVDDLLTRIETVTHRAAQLATGVSAASPVHAGVLTVDPLRAAVTIDGRRVKTTRTELLLLAELARHPNQAQEYEHLAQAVWGEPYEYLGHALQVHVGRLNHRLAVASDGQITISNRRHVGYLLAMS